MQRDEATGDIIFRAKNDDVRERNLQERLQMIRKSPVTEEFLKPRADSFADWREPEPKPDPGAASDIDGTLKNKIKCEGIPIGDRDTLIASHTLAADFILVTHNTKHFDKGSG